jgi:hypothetical protein
MEFQMNKLATVSKKVGGVVASASALALVAMANAHAALDASVGTAFTAVKDDAVSLSAIVTPIVVSILGLALVLKLIKRFGNKI